MNDVMKVPPAAARVSQRIPRPMFDWAMRRCWPRLRRTVLTFLGMTLLEIHGLAQFGYLSIVAPPGASTIADPLYSGSNTLSEIMPNVAPGTMLLKYSPILSNYTQQVFNPPFGWMPNPQETLAPGEGAWLVSPVPQTITFVGLQLEPTPRPRPTAGRYLVSSPAPVASGFEQLMGFPPLPGDRVYQYDAVYPAVPPPGTQATSVHTFGPSGWDLPPTIPLAKSVFVDLVPDGGHNAAPQIQPLYSQVLHAGMVLQLPVFAVDPDGPPGQLTYSLDPGGPPGAHIDALTGFLTWATAGQDADQVFYLTVRVTDQGLPPASSTNTFAVVVTRAPEIESIRYMSGYVTLSWSAIPGAIYHLSAAPTLDGPWTERPTDITTTNSTGTTTDYQPPSVPTQYYRITTVPRIPTTTTWNYCMLLQRIVPATGITGTPVAPPAGEVLTAENEKVPFIVAGADVDVLIHTCVCIQPFYVCASSKSKDIQDTVTYQWALVAGGGTLTDTLGPATLYEPPALTNGEVRTITLKVEITDSRKNDKLAKVTYTLEISRLGDCSYKRKVTIVTDTDAGAPVVITPSACPCEPVTQAWLEPPALKGTADKEHVICVGERLVLHASGIDDDQMVLVCSGECGTVLKGFGLVDETKYVWSADRGAFPDHGGPPTSNSRRTTVIYKAPDTAGDDTVRVVTKDSGVQAPDNWLTNEIKIKVVKITDVNRAASDTNTHKIASVQTVPCVPKLHFVTVKGSNDIVLQATVEPNDDATKNLITWERQDGGAITSPVDGDKTKAKLSRNEDGKKIPIRIKVNGEPCRDIIVWVIWGTGSITRQPAVRFSRQADTTISNTPTTSAVCALTTNYTFKFIIKPPEIVTDPDRPDLAGAKTGGPPGGNSPFTGNPLSGGATLKWDVTRRAQYRILNPNLIPKGDFSSGFGTIYDGQPQADSLGAAFPTDTVVGNDDSGVSDEDNNPYAANASANLGHAVGEVSSLDAPTIWMPESGAANNFTYEEQDLFGEFLRVELGGTWYRASDFVNWKLVMKLKFQGGQWTNNGCATGPGN